MRVDDSIQTALGARPVSSSVISIAHGRTATRVRLDDGRDVFVKSGDARVVEAEARGLRWMGEGGARVPEVLATTASALVLEWIDVASATREANEAFGRTLAALHRSGAYSFGLDHDNWLASIPQDNRARVDWPTFYAERRLAPLLARAVDRDAASVRMRRGVEDVVRTIRARVGPDEPPSRLHGDLWSGNVLWDARGAVLIDPAVYGGHREIDLAMMHLFGGFDPRTFAAYAESAPLASGHRERVPLYQLLPLLAHCVLFGGGYVASVEQALDRLGAA